MTPAERKEMAEILRGHARQLAEKARPIFADQIARLHRQADRLDPPMVKAPPERDTAEVRGPCIHGA